MLLASFRILPLPYQFPDQDRNVTKVIPLLVLVAPAVERPVFLDDALAAERDLDAEVGGPFVRRRFDALPFFLREL